MKIGLIDVDGHSFPNIPLMKLSAWHKAKGDEVVWYEQMFTGHCDKVYMSKVFSFTPDYVGIVDADEIVKGGSGYAIELVNGKEIYNKDRDPPLPDEIEHIYPDYSIYPDLTQDTAYGFMSRGCPRGCEFCHVARKEGRCSVKVADLNEFWKGQKNICLCDPNVLACNEWEDILGQLAESKATVDFNQGIDIRLMTDEKAKALSKVRTKRLHFAWDRYEDKDKILPKFKTFREISTKNGHDLVVFVLCGFDTTLEQDLDRVYTLRDLGYAPYVMLYNKDSIPKGHDLRKLQRWVNNRILFWKVTTFEEYKWKQ